MTESYPDIEIYIKRPDIDDLLAWIDERIGLIKSLHRYQALTCELKGEIECVIVENAVKGGYTSIWFKSPSTPWASDEDCALEAFDRFQTEVRCSPGPWQEGIEDDSWMRITAQGKSRVNWY